MDGKQSFATVEIGVVADSESVALASPQLQDDEVSDEQLMKALVDRPDWALDGLYLRYSGPLYSLAYHMVGNQTAAEDLLQEVFLSIWRSAGSYTSRAGSVRNWLFSIMHHRAIDYIRYKRRHTPAQETVLEEAERNEDVAIPDVWDDTWRNIQASIIRECLARLHPEQRATIELVYFHGWTQAEISQKLSIPLGTVKSRVRLGLLHLRRELEKRGIVSP